jgi:hypothetical protein
VGTAVGGTAVGGSEVGGTAVGGMRVGVSVGGRAVIVAVGVRVGAVVGLGTGVRVATLGTYNNWPVWIREPRKQLALCSATTVV